MTITLPSLVVWLIIGAVAGWLAGVVMKGRGFGLLGNILVGIVGAFIGGWVLSLVGVVIGEGIPGAIINAFIGAVILLGLIGIIKKR